MRPTRDKATNIYDVLFFSLSVKGLMPCEIPKICEDVVNIIRDGGDFSLASMNYELNRLGWRECVMDSISFELFISILAKEHGYKVKKVNYH